MFNSIWKKFEIVRDDLNPQMDLNDYELQLIDENRLNYINEVLTKYSSSDIKRLFVLTPDLWNGINKRHIIAVLKNLETINSIDPMYGFLSFFHNIIGVDILFLIKTDIKYQNEILNDYLFDNYKNLRENLEFDRSELTFMNVDSSGFDEFKTRLIKDGILELVSSNNVDFFSWIKGKIKK